MSKFQLFALEIDTHDAAKINAVAAEQDHDLEAMAAGLDYFKCLADLQADAIREHVLPHVEQDALPLFLAPEFFFKCKGRPFDYAAFFNGCEYLKTLSAQIPDVLWIPGTIWWQTPDKDDARKTVVHNTALVLRAGRIVHSWQKVKVSDLDGLEQEDGESWDRHLPEYETILDETQDPFFGIDVDGAEPLAAAIEVCLDHGLGYLRSEYEERNGEAGAGVDLHILTAAGMTVHGENVIARSGGYIVRCDGGEGPRLRSQCLRVEREGATGPAALRAWDPTLTSVEPETYSGADPTDEDHRVAVYPAVEVD